MKKTKEFINLNEELNSLLDQIKKDISKGAFGNAKASQRARVNLVKLEKLGRFYRKFSVEVFRTPSQTK